MNKQILIGIYKITSPNNKIYIGQAVNIYKRWNDYKCLDCKGQRYLYSSLKKHGVYNHKFEIIHIIDKGNLTNNEIKQELNRLETFYINKFNSFLEVNNKFGMNLTKGGGSIEISKETRIKQSECKIGEKNPFYGKIHSEDAKNKIRKAHIGKKKNAESVKKGAEKRKGLKRTDEFKNKMRLAKTGVKLSQETIAKMINSRKGRVLSEETKIKIRLANTGKKKSPESIKKTADAKRGKKQSEETKLKKSIASKGDKNPMYGRTGINNPNFGRKSSEEMKAKISGENHWTKKKCVIEKEQLNLA